MKETREQMIARRKKFKPRKPYKPVYDKAEFEIALHVMYMNMKPNETMSFKDMSDICGCSKDTMVNIYNRAVKNFVRKGGNLRGLL